MILSTMRKRKKKKRKTVEWIYLKWVRTGGSISASSSIVGYWYLKFKKILPELENTHNCQSEKYFFYQRLKGGIVVPGSECGMLP